MTLARFHGDSDPDPDPDWLRLRLHGGKLDLNPDSDHLSHVDCDPDSNPDSGPGARFNAVIETTTFLHLSSNTSSNYTDDQYYSC